jgi:hypothetical protein
MIEWEDAGNPAMPGFEERSRRFTPYPPVAVSREVYEQATDLLGDVGLDLDISEEEDNEWDL